MTGDIQVAEVTKLMVGLNAHQKMALLGVLTGNLLDEEYPEPAHRYMMHHFQAMVLAQVLVNHGNLKEAHALMDASLEAGLAKICGTKPN